MSKQFTQYQDAIKAYIFHQFNSFSSSLLIFLAHNTTELSFFKKNLIQTNLLFLYGEINLFFKLTTRFFEFKKDVCFVYTNLYLHLLSVIILIKTDFLQKTLNIIYLVSLNNICANKYYFHYKTISILFYFFL